MLICSIIKKTFLVKWIYFTYKNIKLKLYYPNLQISFYSRLNNCDINSGNVIRIGENSMVTNSKLGNYATIYDQVILTDSELGDYSYIAFGCLIGNVSIGKFCSIGPGVKCGLGIHPTDNYVSTHPIFFSDKKQAQISFADKSYFVENKRSYVGNDVWIGANVVILDGVNIGDGAIIAAGAVVHKDVPSYAIMGGIPAKLIKYRFTEENITYLQGIKWWNKDIEYIRNNWKLWHDIDAFKKVNK